MAIRSKKVQEIMLCMFHQNRMDLSQFGWTDPKQHLGFSWNKLEQEAEKTIRGLRL